MSSLNICLCSAGSFAAACATAMILDKLMAASLHSKASEPAVVIHNCLDIYAMHPIMQMRLRDINCMTSKTDLVYVARLKHLYCRSFHTFWFKHRRLFFV